MIRVQHVILPAGLTACVRRDARGEIEVFVAAGLEPSRVRSAVRMGLRSYGMPGWRGALLPVLLLLPLTGGLSWLRALARLLRAHAIGAAAAATGVGVAAATSAVLIVSAPPQQHAPAAGPTPAPTRLHHRSHQSSPAAQPVTIHQAVPSGQPAAHHRSQSHQAGGGSRPAPSHPAQPSPSPSPSGSNGTGSGGGGCVRLLGLNVCL